MYTCDIEVCVGDQIEQNFLKLFSIHSSQNQIFMVGHLRIQWGGYREENSSYSLFAFFDIVNKQKFGLKTIFPYNTPLN